MNLRERTRQLIAFVLALVMVVGMMPVSASAAADSTLTASLNEAKAYINSITINSSANDPATVVKNFKTHFTWDNEKRENSKSYLFDWSYYNGVVFEGIEYVYEVTGESVYKDYVVEYMSSMINANGGWATCSNNSSKQCAGYNSTHGADCYMTAALLLDTYEMTGDSRYLTMAATLYNDLDNAAKTYLLKNAGNNYRHTWASDPSPDLWLDGLYMILPFRAEYAKYIGDQEELDLIVSRMQWVSDNMYNSSKKLFYHAADNASSKSGTYWLRSIGWYAAAIVDIMDSMEGDNLETMKKQLVKLVDGMKACQNTSNGMWLNNMNAAQSSSNPYETSGTALTCYAVMKAVNNGWLDESYADMAILAFNGICNEKLTNNNLKDICFKGAPGSSNSTFYDNEGKGLGPFIMFYAEMLEYVNKPEEPETPAPSEPEETEPEETEPTPSEPEETEPAPSEPTPSEPTVPEEPEEEIVYTGKGNLTGNAVYTRDKDGINSGEKYLIVYSGKALQNNNGVDANPAVTINKETITLADDSKLAWTITKQSGDNYYVENNGYYVNLNASGDDPINTKTTVYITRSTDKYRFRNASGSGAYLRYSSSQLFCAGTSSSNYDMHLYRRTSVGTGSEVVFTLSPAANVVKPGSTLALNGTVTVAGNAVDLSKCTITWSSSDVSVATVANGTVTAKAAGTAQITATLSAANGTGLISNIVLTIPVTVQDHEYQAVVTAPTCTDKGYTTYTCSICGDSYTADEVAALGHSYTSKTIEATCEKDGSIVYTCACGDTYTEVIPAKGHSYASVVTAPTCTKPGFTTYTCACGHSYTADETAALGHTYTSKTTDATCEKEGFIVYTCACGDTYTEVIPAKGHSYSSIVTAPTCTKPGFTTYTCACGHSYTADETAALGHTYTSKTTEATCEKDGSIVYTCACGDTYTEVIPAKGHSYTSVVTAPTCTGKGFTTHTCACGSSYITDEVAALGHKHQAVVTAPTCETAGYTTYTCFCGDTYTADQVAALGHNLTSVVTEATCTTPGFTTHTCRRCGDVTVDDHVDALGHANETVTVEPTCTEEGKKAVHCTRCGENSTEILPALGHSYKAVVTAPTCTEGGFTTYTCFCGDTYVGDKTAALGHTYTAKTTEATCEKDGSIVYTCTCGDTYTEVIPAKGHSYSSVVTAPTCTENGFTTYTCSCGNSYVSDEVAALGHKHQAVVTAPTCENAGYTTYTCVCGDTYIDDQTPALGHTYTSKTTEATCEKDGATVYTCACGDTYTEVIPAKGHSYSSVVTAPTCTEGGFTTYTCVCGDSYVSDQVSALGHSYTTSELNGALVHTCGTCGHSYTENLPWTTVGTAYILDTDGIDVGSDHKYIVVGSGNDYALTLDGTTVGSAPVTIVNNTIVLDDPSAFEFYFASNSSEKNTHLLTRDGSRSIYHVGGEINYGHDSKGYWYFGSASNGQYQLYDKDGSSWYLNYGYVWANQTVSRFAVSSNARTVRLFQESEVYARLCGSLTQTVSDTDNISIEDLAAKFTIELSTNGSDVTGTTSVTADMLDWYTEIDTAIAGTYTADVYYDGFLLGTITVNITTNHSYETVIVAPTCTDFGYTEITCTECGVSHVYDYTDPIGHSYTYTDTVGSRVYTCSRCSHSYSEPLALSCSQVSSFTSGNRFVIAVKSGGNYYAMSHTGNSIRPVQITVYNGKITSSVTDDLLWSYNNGTLSYTNNGTTFYLYSYTSGWWYWSTTEMGISTSNSASISFSSNKLKIDSLYLRYSNSSFSVNSAASAVYIFKAA